MSRAAVVCVVSRNYLPGARVLARSVRETIPGAMPFTCLVDRPPSGWDIGDEPAECIFADSLGIPAWRRFAFQYTAFELACALKPHAIRHLLDRGFDPVIYVDGDQRFYAPPSSVTRALDAGASVVLTPHVKTPVPAGGVWSDERAFLGAGAYNAGFLAVRASETTDRFLAWWTQRLARDCITDVAGGLHVDQRWLDLAPGLFPNVHLERSPGVNAAFWTLWSDALTRSGQEYRVGGTPLVCFHFTGFDPREAHVLSRNDLPGAVQPTVVLAALTSDYANDLERAGWAECRGWGYGFDHLSDGTAISRYWREAIRADAPSLRDIEDPFDVGSTQDLAGRLTALESEMQLRRLDWRLGEIRLNTWQRFLRRYLGA